MKLILDKNDVIGPYKPIWDVDIHSFGSYVLSIIQFSDLVIYYNHPEFKILKDRYNEYNDHFSFPVSQLCDFIKDKEENDTCTNS